MLRRSAGLASGFLAIVGAEPQHSPPALLPRLMGELLRLVRHKLVSVMYLISPTRWTDDGSCLTPQTKQAEASDGSDWRTRIHALNVLRLLLLDGGPSREAARAHMASAMAVVLQVS